VRARRHGPRVEFSVHSLVFAWSLEGHSIATQARKETVISDIVERVTEGKRVFLQFEAVDESAWLYVDGKLVAWYDTAYPDMTWDKPFLLEVTGSLKSRAEHLLAIRVGNTVGFGGIDRPVSLMVEKWTSPTRLEKPRRAVPETLEPGFPKRNTGFVDRIGAVSAERSL